MPARAFATLILALLCGSGAVRAADGDASGGCFLTTDTCQLAGLETPTSPAFMLIGVSPTQVERPTTPQDVAMTAFDIASTSGGVPRNLALEIAPYWLFPHPRLTYDAYVNPSLAGQLAYNASLSVATAPVTGETTATDLAVGLRSFVFVDLATPAQRAKVASAEKLLRSAEELRNLANAYKGFDCGGQAPGPACPGPEGIAARYGRLLEALGIQETDPDTVLGNTEAQLPASAQALQDALTAREGIVISLAGAASGRTPTDKTIRWGEPTKGAAWLDAGYENPVFAALAVVRYTHVNQDGALAMLDAGARLTWVAPRFALSAEYVRRSVLARPAGSTFSSSDRATATIELPVTDNVWVSATAGQDAATETRPSTLITLVGVSFQASRERRVALK